MAHLYDLGRSWSPKEAAELAWIPLNELAARFGFFLRALKETDPAKAEEFRQRGDAAFDVFERGQAASPLISEKAFRRQLIAMMLQLAAPPVRSRATSEINAPKSLQEVLAKVEQHLEYRMKMPGRSNEVLYKMAKEEQQAILLELRNYAVLARAAPNDRSWENKFVDAVAKLKIGGLGKARVRAALRTRS